ncbi:MAG: GNAT family N-acetyltransferase [Candidatus Tectomicrobia bacterium]|nr:GNAT family N-acetyltransferase [Candidatus Tectomicrobia bacterium]
MAEIRLYGPGEGEALRRLMEEAFGPGAAGRPGEPPALPEGCRAWLGGSDSGGPAAFCRAVPDRETRARGRLCLDALFVSAPHRRRGLGRALLRAAQECARGEGLEGVWGYFPAEVPPAFLSATGGRKLRTLRFFRRGRLESVLYPRVPQGYRVRPMSLPGDLAAAAALYNAVFARMWNFRAHAPGDIAEWFEGGDTAPENCLLLESLSEPAGLLGMAALAVDPSRLQAGDKTAYIPDIGVVPDHRGKGWGEILIAAAAARAREAGLAALELIADAEDAAVCAFYRRMGFEERGVIQVYEWGLPGESST